MKLTRRKRIALELLGPPLLGGTVATLWAWCSLMYLSLYRYESPREVAGQIGMIQAMWLLYGVFAFPMIGIQTACYTAFMEWRFSRGLSPSSWRAVTLSVA